jgi:anaerobic ribonucleoside-triphosphate reductase
MSVIKSVVKRDGSVVDFTPQRITNAIYRAAVAVGGRDKSTAEYLSNEVVRTLEAQTPAGEIPTVEQIQDTVEKVLRPRQSGEGLYPLPGGTRPVAGETG